MGVDQPETARNLDGIQPRYINWFPGHMLKAEKELSGQLKRVDAVLELRDARIPLASVNPRFEKSLGTKQRLILFNKTALADEQVTQAWSRFFQKSRQPFLFIDVLQNRGLRKILPMARETMLERWDRFRAKGIRPPPLRLMVVGIPNVGKSSLINRLAHRKAAGTGPAPGVTRHQEWILLGREVELLDTPGILIPKIESLEKGFHLTLTGAVKDEIVGAENLAEFLLDALRSRGLEKLSRCYGLSETQLESGLAEMLGHIGSLRGCLKKGGVDRARAAAMLLKDFRAGSLGPVSFEMPG